MNAAAVAHLTANLDKLIWPGDDTHDAVPVTIPGIRQSAIPPEVADRFAQEAGMPHSNIARLIVEAEMHSLDQAGFEINTKAEIAALRTTAATEQPRHRQVSITCNSCHQPIIRSFNIDAEKPMVSGPALLSALKLLDTACPHGRIA